jgi:hypothetical protein
MKHEYDHDFMNMKWKHEAMEHGNMKHGAWA